MGDLNNKIEQRVDREEVMKLLFGDQFEDLVDDGFGGSKEEYQIFEEVFCRTNMEDAKIDDTHTKLLATNVSVDQSRGNAKMSVKETRAFESFQESSSSCGGSSSRSFLMTWEKISPMKHLCQEKDPGNVSYPDTSTYLVCLHPSQVVQDAPLERPPYELVPSSVPLDCGPGGLSIGKNGSTQEKSPKHSYPSTFSDLLVLGTSTLPINEHEKEPQPHCEVDSLEQGVVSTYNIFNCDGDTDTTKFTDYSVVLNHNGRVQNFEDGKVAVEGKSVTSPLSQESVASGLLTSSACPTPRQTSSGIICVEKSAKTPLSLDGVDAVVNLKRNAKRKLPCCLELYAHRLLVDAGWKIEPRQRNDRTRPAYLFKNAEEGIVTKALSVAWKACGRRLLASESELEWDENGREWWDADSFWRDMTDTMAFIDNEATQKESFVSLPHRWKLLDPFMAVVWIDKKVGALRAGKGLRAVKSATFTLSSGRKMILADMGSGNHDKGSGEVNSCLANSLNQSIVPYCQNSKATDLQNSHNLAPCKGLNKRDTKSLARHTGKGLCNVKCLPMVSAGLVSRRKRSKRLFRKATFIQRDPHFLYSCNNGNKNLHGLEEETPSLGGDDDSGKIDGLSELQSSVDNACQLERNIVSSTGIDLTSNSVCQKISLKPKRAAVVPTDHSAKIVRKKSKKISEVGATEAIGNEKKRKLSDDNRREEFALSMGVEHHKPIMRECRTKRLNSNESSSMISKKKKITTESNMAHELLVDRNVADFVDSRYVPKESDGDGTCSKDLVITSGGSTDHGTNQKLIKANKSNANKKNGQKKLPRFRINDDDLLISAIIKNKDFSSPRKKFSPKAEASQLKALRKLTGQKGKCKLVPRALKKGGNHYVDGGQIILGTRTVLSWLIEMGAVSLKDAVQCRNPKNNAVVKDGWVTREGILCKCCTQVFSVSGFKTHAGLKQHKPSLNLLMLSGKPYALCQLQAWSTEFKKRKSRLQVMAVVQEDENDDTCGICGDGGDLLCCDNCPSTYHQTCLSTQELPEGNWYCTNCICVKCSDLVNGKATLNSLAVFECSQCGHKYHSACTTVNTACYGEIGSSVWFCGASCQEVYMGLRSLVGVANYIDDGLSWTVLRCSHNDKKVCSEKKIALMAECNTKLAIALTLMEECFLRMVDPRTGIDMIPHVLYNLGSAFARLNYQGFYAVVLENGDQLTSVASIRVHGTTLAEMPLIATCSEHRRQGMCRRLLNAIEKMLISLKVKLLVLSAVPSVVETWTSGFGFKPVGDGEKQQLTNINLMTFPGTILLKKNLFEASAQESDLISGMDAKSPPPIFTNAQAGLSFQQRETEPIEGDKVAVASVQDNNDAILSDDQAEKCPFSLMTHQEGPKTLRNVEDNTSILIKDNSVDMLNDDRKISTLGDEAERKCIIDASKGNDGGCIADEIGPPNLDDRNSEGIVNGEVTRDENCGFIAKHAVSKGCTIWSVGV